MVVQRGNRNFYSILAFTPFIQQGFGLAGGKGANGSDHYRGPVLVVYLVFRLNTVFDRF